MGPALAASSVSATDTSDSLGGSSLNSVAHLHLPSVLSQCPPAQLSQDGSQPLRLRLVQVLHRHGDRSPVALWGKSEHEQRREIQFWQQVLLDAPGFHDSRSMFQWSDLNQHLHDLNLVLDDDSAESPPEFLDHRYPDRILGQLSLRGSLQTQAVGRILRALYVDTHQLLPATLEHPDTLALYSSNFRRTVLSLDNVLLGLYPRDQRAAGLAPLPTRIRWPVSAEPLFPASSVWRIPGHGGLDKQVLEARERQPDLSEIRSRLVEDLGLKGSVSWTHVRDALTTAEEHGMPGEECALPRWIVEDSQMAKEVYRHACFKWDFEFSTPQTIRFGIGRLVDEIVARCALPKAMSHREYPRLFVYSGHDNSVLMLLKACGMDFANEWPPYASYVIVETYEDNHGQLYCRVIYNGAPIMLPVEKNCEWRKEETTPELVTIKEFRTLLERFTPDQYFVEFPHVIGR